MPSDQCNSITAKDTGLISHCSASLQSERCNTFLSDLPVSSFVFQLTVKNVDLVVARDGFLCITEIIRIFHSVYLDYRGAIQPILNWFILLCDESNTADREGKWIQTITRECHTINIFHSGCFDYRHNFWTVLDLHCCVTGWT